MDSESIHRVYQLTANVGLVYAGLGPDARVLVRKGRKKAEQYIRRYGGKVPVSQLVRELAYIMQVGLF